MGQLRRVASGKISLPMSYAAYTTTSKNQRVFSSAGGGVQIFMSTSVHLAPDGASTIPASAQLITDTYAYVVHKDICKGVKL